MHTANYNITICIAATAAAVVVIFVLCILYTFKCVHVNVVLGRLHYQKKRNETKRNNEPESFFSFLFVEVSYGNSCCLAGWLVCVCVCVSV